MLMGDVPGEDRYDADRCRCCCSLVALLVGLQVQEVGREDELLALGLPDWRGPALSAAVEDVVQRPPVRCPRRSGGRWRRCSRGWTAGGPASRRAGCPDTLVHGDVHPGNARGDAGSLVLIDWGDCGVGHPLLDQPAMLARLDAPTAARVRDAWEGAWQRRRAGVRPAPRRRAAGAARRGAAGRALPGLPRPDRAGGAPVPPGRPAPVAPERCCHSEVVGHGTPDRDPRGARMRRRTSLSLLATSVAAGLALGVTPAAAAAAPPEDRGREVSGNGGERNAAARPRAGRPRAGGPVRQRPRLPAADRAAGPAGQPGRRVDQARPACRTTSSRRGSTPCRPSSDRVCVEVIGQQHAGPRPLPRHRDRAGDAGQARGRSSCASAIEERPGRRRQGRAACCARYKAPVWINGNIHGNEWEGTDGALRVIEELARSTDPAAAELLERTRLYFMVTDNPDGRVAGTRANAAGFDINRDYITASQPEVAGDARGRHRHPAAGDARRARLHRRHADRAGAPPPHGQNYEYDLYIKHALANALGMEAAIQRPRYGRPPPTRRRRHRTSRSATTRPATGTTGRRSSPRCTRCTTARSGTPSRSRCGSTTRRYDTLPVEELRRRVGGQHRRRGGDDRGRASPTPTPTAPTLIADQIELFRRGWAGEPQREQPGRLRAGLRRRRTGYTTDVPARVRHPGRSPASARRPRRPGSSTTSSPTTSG